MKGEVDDLHDLFLIFGRDLEWSNLKSFSEVDPKDALPALSTAKSDTKVGIRIRQRFG
ncbi:MAG: hypothetical protein IPL94_12765 [Tetrasphaera sp.]|nr:hypothetical protein [Tetrasphaera sp.]